MNLDKNIGWCTHTHNIMTGCLNKKLGICNVTACYAEKTTKNKFYRKAFPYGFEPHFYFDRIDEVGRQKTPMIIFMDSMSDMFGSWWPENQIRIILDLMRGCDWHKYVVLTKNPSRMVDILSHIHDGDRLRYPPELFQHVYFGTSVSGLYDMREITRLDCLKIVHKMGFKTMLSIEPLLYDPSHLMSSDLSWVDWIAVGGQTKPVIIPPDEWVDTIIESVPYELPVFLKDNLGFDIGSRTMMFPADLLPIAQAWGKI